jgi:hypothetical protein
MDSLCAYYFEEMSLLFTPVMLMDPVPLTFLVCRTVVAVVIDSTISEQCAFVI